jgi:hypothetical protein
VHKAVVFKTENERQVHIQTGVSYPQKFSNWVELPDSVKENISPELVASIGYQYVSEKMDWKPTATLYIMRTKTTSNLKLVENQVIGGLQVPVFVKTEVVSLKKKKKIILSVYSHDVPWTSTSGSGAKNLKVIHSHSLFATLERDSQKVAWVIVDRDSLGWKELAFDFFEQALIDPQIEPAMTVPSKIKKTKKKFKAQSE